VNTGAPWPTAEQAEARVLRIQTKLHQRAADDPERRFDDLFNLVYDPAVLTVAWRRVRSNRGARTAGVDAQTAYGVTVERGEATFLAELAVALKSRTFRPLPVRERLIPKPGGKRRRLGIPTVKDRVVQAALKLVLEPIFEAGFRPCSYGFRPRRRVHDAIAEIHHFCSRSYEWVVEGDIEACFDSIDHRALLNSVRRRIGDKRVVALVKAFLKAGILTEAGTVRDTVTGTPQGGILSPLLANIALSVLDDHFAGAWERMGSTSAQRQQRRLRGLATYRLVRYADDFVVVVAGTKAHAEALREEAATLLRQVGLHLSSEKTRISHVDEGFDFLGFRIKRHRKRGTGQRFVYTYPSKDALASVKARMRALTRGSTNQPLAIRIHQLNRVIRGWTSFFRHGVSKRTFGYLRAYVWRRVVCWLRHKHPGANWRWLRRRYLPRWWPTDGEVVLFNPAAVAVTRYRWRAARIPSPWVYGTAGAPG
jgi:RNA-directed DNA polymerase